jgi:hypothetical protein
MSLHHQAIRKEALKKAIDGWGDGRPRRNRIRRPSASGNPLVEWLEEEKAHGAPAPHSAQSGFQSKESGETSRPEAGLARKKIVFRILVEQEEDVACSS